MVQISIIILNWNQADLTINCVKSVLNQTYNKIEILVVDNASSDDSFSKLRKTFSKNKKVKLLKNKLNEGYAGGNNFGVKHSKGQYIVILNNDTIVHKNWLTELIKGLESSKDVASVCSEEIRNSVLEGVNYKTTGIGNSILGYSIRYKYSSPIKNSDFVELFPIKGVSFIYKKSLVNLPFDKDYFLYAEDFYLGWLFKLKGYRNLLSTKSIVDHFNSVSTKSSKKISKLATFFGERNKLLNAFIFLERKNVFKLFFPIVLSTILINCYQPKKFFPRLKSYWWLLTHLKTVINKRKKIQKQRKVPDNILLKGLSYKILDEKFVKNIFLRTFLYLINSFLFAYYKLLGVKFVDLR